MMGPDGLALQHGAQLRASHAQIIRLSYRIQGMLDSSISLHVITQLGTVVLPMQLQY